MKEWFQPENISRMEPWFKLDDGKGYTRDTKKLKLYDPKKTKESFFYYHSIKDVIGRLKEFFKAFWIHINRDAKEYTTCALAVSERIKHAASDLKKDVRRFVKMEEDFKAILSKKKFSTKIKDIDNKNLTFDVFYG